MSNKHSQNGGGYRCLCPACGERMRIQSVPTECPATRMMLGQCQNFLCGATYTGTLSFNYALTPSKLEQPLMRLPTADEVRAENQHRRQAAKGRPAA